MLEQEHRDVAHHVHEYYSTIATLERTLHEAQTSFKHCLKDKKELQEEYKNFLTFEHKQALHDVALCREAVKKAGEKLQNSEKAWSFDEQKLKSQIEEMAKLNQTEVELKREAQKKSTKYQTDLAALKMLYMTTTQHLSNTQLEKAEIDEKLKFAQKTIPRLEAENQTLKSQVMHSASKIMNLDSRIEELIQAREHTKKANESLVAQLMKDVQDAKLPYQVLLEQNAMIGEDIRAQAVENTYYTKEKEAEIE